MASSRNITARSLSGNSLERIPGQAPGTSAALVRALLALGALAVFVALGLRDQDGMSGEAVVCEGICRELLAKTTEGRQALVSSVWWAPLPVLLRLPLAALFRSPVSPLASLGVSALFGVGTLLLLERILFKWRAGRLRWIMIGALAAHPRFVERCCDGSSGTTIVFLACVSVYGLVSWVGSRQLRFLVYLAVSVALLALTSFEMWIWLAVVLSLAIADLAAFNGPGKQKEAVLIMLLLPLAYALGLWILLNWLIMGDGLYFLRSLFAGVGAWQELAPRSPKVPMTHILIAGMAMLTIVAAAERRHIAGVFMGMLGLSPVLVMNFLMTRRLFWAPEEWECVLLPLFVMMIGYLGEFRSVISPRLRACVAWLPLALLWSGLWAEDGEPARGTNVASVMADRNEWLPRIERHVTNRARYVKVFVCGYDSFYLLGPDRSNAFLHAMDFNFFQAKEAYPGHVLYVLVHRPTGRSAMDSIHWKYKGIFMRGSRDTLYDGDWGNWRLFEIIQARD